MIKKLILLSTFCLIQNAFGQSFELIPLGVYGGGEESNLSAYLLGEKNKNEFIALDAGTLRSGINKAIENKIFEASNTEVLKNFVKAYFISHGHLDHLSGMIINSPEDSKKNIYATSRTIDVLKDKYFTNDAWTNFANEGELPQLKKYTYKRIDHQEFFSIEGTNLKGRIFKLSHVKPDHSSAILVSNANGENILYLGDTGADRIENSKSLENLWTEVAPLIKNKTLKAIMIEVSFDNSRAEHFLFGHLTPKLLQEELSRLAQLSGQSELKDLKVIITHIKPDEQQEKNIKDQLYKDNQLNVNFIFPKQGERIIL